MVTLFRHRQPKGAAPVKPHLSPPRHIPTLPTAADQAGVPATAALGGVRTSVRRRLAPCGSRGPLVRARHDDVEDQVLDLVVRGRISRCPPGEAFLD
jgi:hypothetical protein